MKFKFEKLIIGQKSMEFGEGINTLASPFPKEVRYNLFSPIRRSTDSVALNISGAAIGQSNPEFKKFMSYAIRSLAEVVSSFYKAKNRKFITDEEFDLQYNDCISKKYQINFGLLSSDFRLKQY